MDWGMLPIPQLLRIDSDSPSQKYENAIEIIAGPINSYEPTISLTILNTASGALDIPQKDLAYPQS